MSARHAKMKSDDEARIMAAGMKNLRVGLAGLAVGLGFTVFTVNQLTSANIPMGTRSPGHGRLPVSTSASSALKSRSPVPSYTISLSRTATPSYTASARVRPSHKAPVHPVRHRPRPTPTPTYPIPAPPVVVPPIPRPHRLLCDSLGKLTVVNGRLLTCKRDSSGLQVQLPL